MHLPMLIAGYTDEAQYNVGRYRGLAMVSVQAAESAPLSHGIGRLLDASGIAECKWEKVRSARARIAASKLLDWAIQQAHSGRMRVDTLTWDTEESSRAGRGVPHIANLRQMYVAFWKAVLPERWGAGTRWKLYPDEQSAMPWEQLIAGVPGVAGIAACRSHEQQLIQLADLFAGLAVYSRASYDLYERWLCEPREWHMEHVVIGVGQDLTSRYSASDRARCLLLDQFFTWCKLNYLGVSLRTRRGLYTGNPTFPFLFFRMRRMEGADICLGTRMRMRG